MTTGTLPINYPGTRDRYRIGKLPAVRKPVERNMCAGRVWIFLLLGVLLVVLGLISFGVYLNVDTVTSSSKYTEIMPLFINSGAIVLSGLTVCTLFWKRLNALVFLVVVVCVATGFLCGTTAVLTSTHILRPLHSFTMCRHYVAQKLCQCFSPYKRDMLSLEYSDTEQTKYDFEDVSGCDSVESILPQLLYTLVGTYSIVFLITIASAILALLVLRTERIKRGFFQDEAYEEVYTVSGTSSQDHSDSETEVAAEVIPPPVVQPSIIKNRTPRTSNSDTLNSTRSNLNVTRSVNNNSSIAPLPKTPTVPRSKTPGLSDFGKESLANRYKINKTPDRDFTVRQRISKTPDREIGVSRRRNSLIVSKRLSKSCDSLDSSGTGSRDDLDGSVPDGRKKGKLKEHRRKGKRAATVHTLDTDQLLLILNLQMRYLQETKEQQAQGTTSYPRRAITPQPSTQKTLPQKVRSHTPQPHRASHRKPDPQEQEFYSQIEALHARCRQNEIERAKKLDICKQRVRHESDSSIRKDQQIFSGNLRNTDFDGCNYQGNINRKLDKSQPLVYEQMSKAATNSNSYTPYLYGKHVNSVDSVHYVTYSDSMLGKMDLRPKSRSSAQNNCLPPQPLHRGTQDQLPPQPISRQRNGEQRLPPAPVHRGHSAFHVVDRGSKSRSPSIASDTIETTPKRKTKKDFGDAAIRDNFKMNPSPFLLQDTDRGNPRLNYHGKVDLDGRAGPSEIPPPYSGPPSYKEYVSSCDNSVNSSLSSNPDDIYSMPKRRVPRDQDLTNQNEAAKFSSNQMNSGNINQRIKRDRNYNPYNGHMNGEDLYGTAEIMRNARNHHGMQKVKGEGHSPMTNGHSEDSVYSSPARSRVKQCIVPEDYYTPIDKRNKRDNIYANDPAINQRVQGHSRVNPSYPTDYGTTTATVSNTGPLHMFNPGENTQIAPDAKYHEYEDVYDTPAGIQEVLPHNSNPHGNIGYSITNHGMETVNPHVRHKQKQRSPKKQKAPYPVSNVSACLPNIGNTSAQGVLTMDSIQNVHAKNVQNIPQIKLNDSDDVMDDITDDDVFVDSNMYRYTPNSKDFMAGSERADTRKQEVPVTNRVVNFGGHTFAIHSNHRDQTNEIHHQSHISEPENQETDSGYMKMSLPGNNGAVHQTDVQSVDESDGLGDTSITSGQNSDLVDSESSMVRQAPSGSEAEQVQPHIGDNYEETGV